MQMNCVTELNNYALRLSRLFDYKENSPALGKQVSAANEVMFEKNIQDILKHAAQLKFITTNTNKTYADEIYKTGQQLYAKGNRILRNKGTNGELKSVVIDESRKISDYVYLIENNEDDFKTFAKEESFSFDKSHFKPVFDKIQLNRKTKRDNFFLYDEELNGGSFLKDAKEILSLNHPDVEHFHLFGIDSDIDLGKKSREYGINSARKSLTASSDEWSDISIAANDFIGLSNASTSQSAEFLNYSFKACIRRKHHKKNSLLIFNIPFYKLDTFSPVLNTHVIEGIYQTGDEAGNLVVIIRYQYTNRNNNNLLIRKAMFQPHTLPTLENVKPILLDSNEDVGPKTFRASYIDLDDIESQFVGKPSAASIIFDYLEPENDDEEARRALQEPKDGHIPTLATSGIVSGRYSDEILLKRFNREIGFDNLFETKIVKRDIEEEQMVSYKGEMVKEISLKKSNIIVSTALTSQGEFIELLNNDTDDE